MSELLVACKSYVFWELIILVQDWEYLPIISAVTGCKYKVFVALLLFCVCFIETPRIINQVYSGLGQLHRVLWLLEDEPNNSKETIGLSTFSSDFLNIPSSL